MRKLPTSGGGYLLPAVRLIAYRNLRLVYFRKHVLSHMPIVRRVAQLWRPNLRKLFTIYAHNAT